VRIVLFHILISYLDIDRYADVHVIRAKKNVLTCGEASIPPERPELMYVIVVLTVIGYTFNYLHRLHFLASSFCIQSNY
jgi:hypothetical protein